MLQVGVDQKGPVTLSRTGARHLYICMVGIWDCCDNDSLSVCAVGAAAKLSAPNAAEQQCDHTDHDAES